MGGRLQVWQKGRVLHLPTTTDVHLRDRGGAGAGDRTSPHLIPHTAPTTSHGQSMQSPKCTLEDPPLHHFMLLWTALQTSRSFPCLPAEAPQQKPLRGGKRGGDLHALGQASELPSTPSIRVASAWIDPPLRAERFATLSVCVCALGEGARAWQVSLF